jgi:NADH dehydrogenase (ubiquinone) 1 alpha subcomplex subunit 2
VQNNYLQIKEDNPQLPFIVRECENAQPTVMARYHYGVEQRVWVENFDEGQIKEAVEELVAQAGKVN